MISGNWQKDSVDSGHDMSLDYVPDDLATGEISSSRDVDGEEKYTRDDDEVGKQYASRYGSLHGWMDDCCQNGWNVDEWMGWEGFLELHKTKESEYQQKIELFN